MSQSTSVTVPVQPTTATAAANTPVLSALSNGNSGADTEAAAAAVDYVLGPSEAVVSGSITSAKVAAAPPPLPLITARDEPISDENNKPPNEDHVLPNHMTTADVLMRTTIDTNNNTSDRKCQDSATSETPAKAMNNGEEEKVATFSNNGSPTLGRATSSSASPRRRVCGVPDGNSAGAAAMLDSSSVEGVMTEKGGEAPFPNKDDSMPLQKWNEMPRYLQFNPYVLTGYRPLQNISGCFASLFYLHNETFNILTHGIPIVYILATVPSKLMWDDYRFLSWCHIVGSVAPWCGSFLYHLFMNLNRGETVYYTLLKLDMLGIWISQSFGALPMVTATVHCLNWPLKWIFIMMYSLLSIWGLYKAMCATSPWQRRLCFLLPFTMRILLTLLRLTRFGGGNPTSMTHIFLQDAVSVAGGAIGAMHIPEKWFPGSMDFYLNSHNIMHVLVVLAVYSMHQATVQDLDWMSKAECLMGTTMMADTIQEASMISSNTEL